jgi:hypothetical protein
VKLARPRGKLARAPEAEARLLADLDRLKAEQRDVTARLDTLAGREAKSFIAGSDTGPLRQERAEAEDRLRDVEREIANGERILPTVYLDASKARATSARGDVEGAKADVRIAAAKIEEAREQVAQAEAAHAEKAAALTIAERTLREAEAEVAALDRGETPEEVDERRRRAVQDAERQRNERVRWAAQDARVRADMLDDPAEAEEARTLAAERDKADTPERRRKAAIDRAKATGSGLIIGGDVLVEPRR